MQTPLFLKKLKERMWKIEGLFAEAKNGHGLLRAKYRGIQKVQIQAHMTAAVQNLKRLIVEEIRYKFSSVLNLIVYNTIRFVQVRLLQIKLYNKYTTNVQFI